MGQEEKCMICEIRKAETMWSVMRVCIVCFRRMLLRQEIKEEEVKSHRDDFKKRKVKNDRRK